MVNKTLKWAIVVIVGIIVVLAATLIPLYCIERDYNFTILNGEASALTRTPDGFTAVANVDVLFNNDNFFKIHLHNVSAVVTHPAYNGTLSDSYVSDVTIAARGQTTFGLPLTVIYQFGNDIDGSYIMELLANCSVEMGTVYFDVHTDVRYSVWARSGTQIDDTSVIRPCPVPPDQVNEWMGQIGM